LDVLYVDQPCDLLLPICLSLLGIPRVSPCYPSPSEDLSKISNRCCNLGFEKELEILYNNDMIIHIFIQIMADFVRLLSLHRNHHQEHSKILLEAHDNYNEKQKGK